MIFINPKMDLAFKKIFGSPQSKEILISFLDALIYGGQPTIEDLEILDPFQLPKAFGLKETYLDVKARLNNGVFVIIEMQVLNLNTFEKRVPYNAAKSYALQLGVGQSYSILYPVIALTITDFVLFPDIASPVTSFIFKERTLNLPYTHNDIELVFAELPKFQRLPEEVETLTEQWLAFLKYARDLHEIPPTMAGVGALCQAFELANQATLNAEELDKLEKSEAFVADTFRTMEQERAEGRQEGHQEGLVQGLEQGLTQGLEQGLTQGLEQGLTQGLKQGLTQGIEKGKREQALATARSLLKLLAIEDVSRVTGLSIAEIQALQTEVSA